MKTIFGYASLLIMALACWAGQGLADESGSDGAFSARVDAGVLWMKTESHLDAGDDNRRINSLTESPKSETEIIPVPAFELAWQMGENTVLYGGIPLEDEPRPTLGFQYETRDFGEFDVSLFYHFPEDVWEDPYLTGVDRTETDMEQYGVRLAWEAGDLELSYELAFQDVDNDAVGARLPDLKREGEIHGFGAAYEFELGHGLALVPEIGMTLGNMDGRSSEYRGLSAGLGLMKHWGDLALMMSVEAGVIDYDTVHPIFDKTREDDTLEAMAMLSWGNPLGYENFRVNLGTGYERGNSNIDFYDSDSYMAFITIGYQFGGGGDDDDDDD